MSSFSNWQSREALWCSSEDVVTAALASHILDAIRDHMRLHVGFCQWTRDDGVALRICAARDNDGQR